MIDGSKKAAKTVSLIIFATAFSKILGLARQMMMAALYGGSTQNTAFSVALNIPLDFFDILFGAAVLGVFIPAYNSFDFKTEKTKKEAEKFANIFTNTVLLASGLLAFFGVIFSRQIVGFIAKTDEETLEMASNLLKILFPMIIFTGAVYSLTGILQSKGEFIAPALVSAVSNFGVVVYFLFLNRYFGVYGLAAAYLVSWIIQLLTLVIPLIRKKYKYRFILDFKNPALKRCAGLALPVMAGSWLVPMGKQIGLHYSTMCPDSGAAVASFTNSWQLFLIVTGILTYGICNYMFPKLAQNAGDEKNFADIVKGGLSAACFVIVPVACLCYGLRAEAVAVIFMRLEYTPELAASTAEMFSMLAPSMIMFSAIEILNRIFYSKKSVKFPMIAAISGIAVNFALCRVFISYLKLPPVYIAFSVLCCQSLTAVILAAALKIKIRGIFDKKFLFNIAKIFLSSCVLLAVTKALKYILKNNAFESVLFKNIAVAGFVAAAGAVCYMAANIVFKTEEAKIFIKMLKKNKKTEGD
ncbi:MAG: murein biosynthesis integral membrane protein MurJ [Oscillospiraceae bacterium]|nr:murein biosynthesis integral membrane protein MurJ [Oscillospiraceae bacterium]